MSNAGDDSSSPATDRLARMEQELAQLAQGVRVLTAAPTEARQSLPVRAAVGGYRLSKKASAIIGLLACLAEVFSQGNGPFRAIFNALFERAPAPQIVKPSDATLKPLDP